MENVTRFTGNGFLRNEETNKRSLTNAHIAYKNRSVIVDYEHCLHYYDKQIPEGTVPVEMYPYQDDISLTYVKLGKYGKVDIEDLIRVLDEELSREDD